MLFSYGNGEYCERGKSFRGEIVLGEHKLYLRRDQDDLAQTYVPLEKIERIRMTWSGLEVQVRPSVAASYAAVIKGSRARINDLARDLARERKLVKRFLKKEWVDETFFDR